MDEHNQKISKSKGNGLTMEEWLRYGAPESLAYYMFQSPKSAKRLYFDVIPKATDEYLQQLDAYNRPPRRRAPTAGSPIRSTIRSGASTRGAPPEQGLAGQFQPAAEPGLGGQRLGQGPSCGASSAGYYPGATPQSEPLLDRLAGYAIHYYEDFVRPAKRFRAPDAPRAGGLRRPAGAAEGPARRLQGRRGDPERGLRGRQGRRLRAAAQPGSARSTRCCSARARARASAPSRRSSGSPKPGR